MDNLKHIINENSELSLDEIGAKEFITGIEGGASALKTAKPGIYGAFADVLSFAKKDKNQIVGLTKKSPNKLVPLTTIDDLMYALKTERGMSADVLGLLNQGLLKSKKTPSDLINNITKEVVGTRNFIKTYGQKTPAEMKNLLKQKGYSDSAVESLMINAKKNPNFKKSYAKGVAKRKIKKTKSGKDVELEQVSSTQPPVPSKFTNVLREKLLAGIKGGWSWKKALIWGIPLGLTAAAIWWALYNSNEPIPDDTPVVEPKPETNDWAECLNDMVYDKLAKIGVTTLGNPVIIANPTEKYPNGVAFYNNNRVQDLKTKDMGTWSCVGGKVETNESVNDIVGRILKEKLLSEQIIDPTVAKHVKEMIDLLDFPVNQEDLKNAVNKLKPYVTNGKGKKFLGDYEKSGYADSSLKTTLDYIYITDTLSKQYREQLYDYIEQIELGTQNVSLPPVNTQTPLKRRSSGMNEQTGVDIVWDKNKKKDDKPVKTGGETVKKNKKFKSQFHDCESKDFPLEFGCKSTKIAEVQKCLGVADDGKLGKNTMKAMVDNKFDTSRGLSQDVYNEILKACNPRNLEPITSLKSKGLKMMDIASPKIDLSKLNQIIQSSSLPIDLYTKFKEEGWIVGDANETYLEDGTVLPPTNRVKYRGPDLNSDQVSQLDTVLSGMGYDRIKQKLDKRYGDKYVWSK